MSGAGSSRSDAERATARLQQLYARWLDAGTRLGFAALAVAFLLYATNALPPLVSLEALPRFWSLPVDEYLRAAGAWRGWEWVRHLHRGDALTFVGIAILAGTTIACYGALLVALLRGKDRLYAAIAACEIAVLVLAAAGLGAGH